jgi:AraC family transcriptional regulator
MFVVGAGDSSGHVVRRLVHEWFTVSLTRHTAEECRGGLHVHERPHLSMVLRGGDVEQRGSSRHVRTPGALGFYDAGESHASLSRSEESLHANIELAPEFLVQMGIGASQVSAAVRANADAPLLLIRSQAELRRNDPTSRVALEAMVTDLVTSNTEKYTSQRPAWVERVAEVVHDAWAGPITLAMLAAHAGVHPVTISKHFRRYFGSTLGNYLRQIRLTRSLPLLATPHEPLSGVAYRCGFSDQSHYTRTFRHHTGFAPGALRHFFETALAEGR